jgi:methylated-DNA-[protein]-cysteine S-methyltransferase
MTPAPQLSCPSPVGDLTVSEDDGAIVSLDFGRGMTQTRTGLLDEAVVQLAAYFDGTLSEFDLPLNPHGTAFQKNVWELMRAIPYGGTRAYADLARDLKSAARAVGGACGANPIPVIIPCHRVLAAGGKMGGFSGGEGIPTKVALLRLEGAIAL